MTYANTLNADGTFNTAAIMALAWAKARRTQRSAVQSSRHLCSAASVAFSQIERFYAREATKVRIPGYVGMVSNYFSAELRAVWAVARELKSTHVAPVVSQYAVAA